MPQVKPRAAAPLPAGSPAAKAHAGTSIALGLVGAAVFMLASAMVVIGILSSPSEVTTADAGKMPVDATMQDADSKTQAAASPGSAPTSNKKLDETPPTKTQSSADKHKDETEQEFIRKLVDFLSKEEQQQVQDAVAKGTAYLQGRDEASIRSDALFDIGCHVLIGWTLLECGVPASNHQVQRVVQRVRDAGPSLTHTYALSLAVIFLNKLEEEKDRDLIRTLSLRLIAGQNQWGGWKYNCPILDGDEEKHLFNFLRATSPAVRIGIIERRPGEARPSEAIAIQHLPERLKELPVVRSASPRSMPDRPSEPTAASPQKDVRLDDNSNTQFAILGVWSALRHGVPVDRTAALVRLRFHETQNHDHSWSYLYRSKESPIPNHYERRHAMTCAGLLGLALANVTQDWERQDRGDLDKTEPDERIRNALGYLGGVVGVENGKTQFGDLPVGADSLGDLYFLWSLERVGVLYRQPHIGGKAWYPWGARLLVAHQRDDGSWHDRFGPEVNTCFALLYLKCANPTPDLTEMLQALDIPQRLRLPMSLPAKESERPPAERVAADPFRTGSVWVNEKTTLTVLEREGESFRAKLVVGDTIERDISGTVKDGKVTWLAKDVEPVKGGRGSDNHGTIRGDRIDFEYRHPNGMDRAYTLRLSGR